jgi:hypothetical protein
VDGYTEGCGNEGWGREHIVEVYPGPIDNAGGTVGESPVNLSIHEPGKGGEAGGATYIAPAGGMYVDGTRNFAL